MFLQHVFATLFKAFGKFLHFQASRKTFLLSLCFGLPTFFSFAITHHLALTPQKKLITTSWAVKPFSLSLSKKLISESLFKARIWVFLDSFVFSVPSKCILEFLAKLSIVFAIFCKMSQINFRSILLNKFSISFKRTITSSLLFFVSLIACHDLKKEEKEEEKAFPTRQRSIKRSPQSQ